MQQGQTLFALQSELVDKKMEATMSTRLATFRGEIRDEFRGDFDRLDKSVLALKEDLNNFKLEMREFKDEMRAFKEEMREAMREFRQELYQLRVEFGARLTAVESALTVIQQRQSEIRTRLLDYSFKAGWAVIFVFIGGVSSSLISHIAQKL